MRSALPPCPRSEVEASDSVSPERLAYLQQLATEAAMHSTHPWARKPSDELIALARPAISHMSGWASAPDLKGLHAHYGVEAWLREVGIGAKLVDTTYVAPAPRPRQPVLDVDWHDSDDNDGSVRLR